MHDKETMKNYGNDVRIEKRFRPEENGEYKWVLYKLTAVVDGKHPHHGHDTTESHVWMIQDNGTFEEMSVAAEALVAKK